MADDEVNRSYTAQEGTPGQGDRSLLASVTNPDVLLNEIEHKIRGEVYIKEKKKWIKVKGVRAKANEQGINGIISKLSFTLNQNTILSNIQPKEQAAFMEAFADRVDLWLCMNRRAFAIEWEDMDFCADAILDPTFFAVKRAIFQGEKKFIQNSLQQKEQVNIHQQPKPGGFVNKLFGK